ncbi:transcription factor SPT20-like protein [Dinothrombium tinctorium]|uniref:Transcription factor SPT20-like protein n=1 Tax=Dinothrombium tinctorium TaxID=1965070 RepID=A0A3S3S310_9ACAR|nr:transcription factor SPT20-like protein [Dinothrombium tinctorium]RWS09615.1 transcription factor SPT20-like protein [Dinothrombium tinctorium]RWS09734.1 transcription factor SPT20-like protein [Dinothrombium tinctorium]RWS09741.1 transcription factor SPT20-like protein [Dinothrombium tinctorium]
MIANNWTPLPTRHSKLLSLSPPDAPTLQAKHKPSTENPHQRSFADHYHSAASNHFPVPVIEPHANGATVGLDLPDSNLRLLLDIDEFASKPIAKHIGYTVVEQEPKLKVVSDKLSQQSQSRFHHQPLASNQHVDKHVVHQQNRTPLKPPVSSHNGKAPTMKHYDVGYIRTADLHHAIKHRLIPEAHENFKDDKKYGPAYSTQKVSLSNSYKAVNNVETKPNTNTNYEKFESSSRTVESRAPLMVGSHEKNSLEEKHVAKASQQSKVNVNAFNDVQQKEDDSEDDGFGQIQVTQEKDFGDDSQTKMDDSFNGHTQQQTDTKNGQIEQKFVQTRNEGQTKEKDSDDEQQQIAQNGNGFDGVKSAKIASASSSAAKKSAKLIEMSAKLTDASGSSDENTILKPFPKSISIEECPAISHCEASCAPITNQISDGTLSIVETAKILGCSEFVNAFPSFAKVVQNLVDLSVNGYTIFIPTDIAFSRLPPNLIDNFKRNQFEFNQLIENHFLMSAQTLEDLRIASIIEPRATNAKLRVKSTKNLGVTVNGQRLVHADQKAPKSGVIHTIDGLLYPVANKDIIETLKSCNRFDGFVTLADGTGISDLLSKEGPYSVFVPSNEALQKIPDNDLSKIRNNMTALKDFLKYHMALGSYYSNDLRDGQFIQSMLANHAIKTGVRVDGCSRNLVELNVSPLYRADIPATNGVIHIIDWILKPEDHDWCEGVILPR